MTKIYDFKALTSKGKEMDFSAFQGKVLLIVNTASKCGLTPQFAGLEALNLKYKDQGLVVIGFPSGDFANQELADGSKAEEFCQLNYGVTFQIMKKVHVNGNEAEPIFDYLKAEAPVEESSGIMGKLAAVVFKLISKSMKKQSDIKWNFTKFLIDREGNVVCRFEPTAPNTAIVEAIETIL